MKLIKTAKNIKLTLSKEDWIKIGQLGGFLPTGPSLVTESFIMDIELEDGTEKEVNVHASGQVYPAESDVGYNHLLINES